LTWPIILLIKEDCRDFISEINCAIIGKIWSQNKVKVVLIL